MTRMMQCALATVALVAGSVARGDITVDQAQQLVEKHAGHSLEGGRVTQRDVELLRIASFDDPSNAAIGRTYSVDLTHGTFKGWYQCSDGAAPDAQPTLSDEEVLRIAKAVLAEHMGPAAADVEWRLLGEADNVVRYYCPGPLLGDPPRHGLSPSGGVEVSRRNGAIMRLSLDMPWSTTPLPVNVTRDEAVRIARTVIGGERPLSRDPTLIQRGEVVKWTVYVGRRDGQERLCEIDATTGNVLKTDTKESSVYPSPEYLAQRSGARPAASAQLTAPTPSSEDPATPVSAPATTPEAPGRGRIAPIAAVAAGLLVVTAGGLVLLRRRRR